MAQAGSEVLRVPAVPELKGEAADAVAYRGGHMQIIASAGSGKTEIVSQRAADLLAGREDSPPVAANSIVAFTFTERAAAELKARIERCVIAHPRLGPSFLDKLNGMFVGTIHSYCFTTVLQRHVPKYANYDALDEHRLTAFLSREYFDVGLGKLGGRFYANIHSFLLNLQVIENELLEPEQLNEPLRSVYEAYLRALDASRFLTYGQMIAGAVRALRDPAIFGRVHGPLRDLIVDEYQDVNPAQEELIGLLAQSPVHLCVVGDDDQSIYQWRGSNVANIVEFRDRYPGVRRPFRIEVNRRSRPQIIDLANHFAKTIDGRLPKTMHEHRPQSGQREVVAWAADTEAEEAEHIARAVRRAHDQYGYAYRDIAILCRTRTAFPRLLEALRTANVPVQPGGRTGLFLQPDADLFGRTICWLVGYDWRRMYGRPEPVTLDGLMHRYTSEYALSPQRRKAVRQHLQQWQARVPDFKRPANLVRDFYLLLRELGVHEWDLADPLLVNRLGTLARCSRVLVDYEATQRRAREDDAGGFRTERDRGPRYHEWLAKYVLNWALGAYEDFEGEEDVELDAVDLTTVHQAKGLEWSVVFVPTGRFPPRKTGDPQPWLVPRSLFEARRYEGTENDERRVFYVALTRARDFLSLSMHRAVTSRRQDISPFLRDAVGEVLEDPEKALTRLPQAEAPRAEDGVLEIAFSDLALYRRCPLAYRLRRLLGFEAPLAQELGLGKGVHHVMRRVADHVRENGKTPAPAELARIFDEEFYMPHATKPAYERMRKLARGMVDGYLATPEYEADLHRVWEVERPFELHLEGARVTGRADVIIDDSGAGAKLAISDYKTAIDDEDPEEFLPHDFQVQVYTSAGQREGLTIDRGLVHDLRKGKREAVPTAAQDIQRAEAEALTLVGGIRDRTFPARPGKHCSRCDTRDLCRYRIV